MTGVLIKRGNLDTGKSTWGRRLVKVKAEVGWCFTSHGMSKIAGKPAEPRREA